jgi:hypothetical protein
VRRTPTLFLALAGPGLLFQGAISLALHAGGWQSDDMPQRLANADPLHASIHVVWGAASLAVLALVADESSRARFVLAFGVFYSGLAVLGLVFHHPLGMHLDRGENVFHLLVAPTALLVGLAGVRGGGPQPVVTPAAGKR